MSLSLKLQHRKQRHQSLAEWRRKCKERRCSHQRERDSVEPEDEAELCQVGVPEGSDKTAKSSGKAVKRRRKVDQRE